jgi:hypothetical protein
VIDMPLAPWSYQGTSQCMRLNLSLGLYTIQVVEYSSTASCPPALTGLGLSRH